MTTIPIFIKLTNPVGDSFFINTREVSYFQNTAVQDRSLGLQEPYDMVMGTLIILRGTPTEAIYALEPVEEVAVLMGDARMRERADWTVSE